jgi:hypothetical protein
MKFLPNEIPLSTSYNLLGITLTNFRLQVLESNDNYSNETIIFLEHISLIEKKHVRKKWLFYSSIMFIIVGFIFWWTVKDIYAIYFFSVSAAISYMIYYFTEKFYLLINLDSGTNVKIEIKDNLTSDIDSLIYDVSLLKKNSINEQFNLNIKE